MLDTVESGDWISLVELWEREPTNRGEQAERAVSWARSGQLHLARAGLAFFRACPEAPDEKVVAGVWAATVKDPVLLEFAAQTLARRSRSR
jgi:hypothetical protein